MLIHNERGQSFAVAILARLHLKHEIHKRATEPRARAIQDREAGAGNLCSSFQIKNAQADAEINMILWREIKVRLCAPASDLDIFNFVFAHWNTVVRNIRKRGEQISYAVFCLKKKMIQLG